MNAETVKYVLNYYVLFWIINSAAYGVVSYGMYRWTTFTTGLDAERALRTTMRITATFGFIRLCVGSIGIGLYFNGNISELTAIITMGMSSLLLNTAFILGEGIFLNREAQIIFKIADTEDNRNLLRKAIHEFELLRRTVKNA